MYARVSSQQQAKEGFSIPAQDKLLRGWHGTTISKSVLPSRISKRRSGPAELVLTR